MLDIPISPLKKQYPAVTLAYLTAALNPITTFVLCVNVRIFNKVGNGIWVEVYL
jgi:hypothetical protein